jgi:hypothetical protein
MLTSPVINARTIICSHCYFEDFRAASFISCLSDPKVIFKERRWLQYQRASLRSSRNCGTTSPSETAAFLISESRLDIAIGNKL